MHHEAKGQVGRRHFVLVVVVAAIAVFVLMFAIFRDRNSSKPVQILEAAANNANSERPMAANGKFGNAASILPDSPPLTVDRIASPPETPEITEVAQRPESSEPHRRSMTSDSQPQKEFANRRIKVVAHSKPEDLTPGYEKRVKDVTLYQDLKAERAAPPGYDVSDSSYIPIPDQCKYVKHEIVLLERRPWNGPEITKDPFTFYRTTIRERSNGEVESLSLGVLATARKELPEGSLIKMRLSVDVHCENGYRGQIDTLAE